VLQGEHTEQNCAVVLAAAEPHWSQRRTAICCRVWFRGVDCEQHRQPPNPKDEGCWRGGGRPCTTSHHPQVQANIPLHPSNEGS
jgi:hypothetical protein